MNLSVSEADVTAMQRMEAVTVICMIILPITPEVIDLQAPEVLQPPIVTAVLPVEAARSTQIVVRRIVLQTVIHRTGIALLQIPMMMGTMMSMKMMIMTGTDTGMTVIMRMAWMMPWRMRIGRGISLLQVLKMNEAVG